MLGNYNGYPSNPVTPLNGIIQKLPNAEVNYAVGCKLADGLPIFEPVPSAVLFTDANLKENGLEAEYFSNLACEGTPLHSQIDKNVDFVWRTTSPFEDINYDQFSARWSGYLSVTKTGKYALGGEAFSGMKLYLNDSLLVQREDVHHPKKEYEYVTLEANKPYKVKLEYKQNMRKV